MQSLYAVHSALSDDTNEGRIRILPAPQNKKLRNEIEGKRRIARIKRRDRKDAKPVYSEALYADDFYIEDWKEIWKKKGIVPEDIVPKDRNVIFISEWYRLLLGTIIGEVIEIDPDVNVKLLNPGSPRELWALLYLYPRNHPQAVVRTASMMAIIGFGSGVIGIGLGVLSINDLLATKIAGFLVCGVGLAIAFLGIIGLIFRR